MSDRNKTDLTAKPIISITHMPLPTPGPQLPFPTLSYPIALDEGYLRHSFLPAHPRTVQHFALLVKV